MAQCTAIIRDGRIQFDIRKEDPGYDELASTLDEIVCDPTCWYGDIRREDGEETSGLVLTSASE